MGKTLLALPVQTMPILTRRELYDIVWAKPLDQVADGLGTSDLWLADICERHRVPIPPRNFWARKEAGQRVKQSIFVEVDDPILNRVDINILPDQASQPVASPQNERGRETTTLTVQAPAATSDIKALAAGDALHPAVASFCALLRKTRPDKHQNAVILKGAGMPEFSASSSEIERLILFFDRLARECDRQQLRFGMDEKWFLVAKGPDVLRFSLTEQIKREPHVLTAVEIKAEKKRKARFARASLGYEPWHAIPYDTPPKFDRRRTGEFVLELYAWSDGLRRTWRDTKTQRLEDIVPSILVGFVARLATLCSRREEQEEREAAFRELERRREMAKAREIREAKRERLLREMARNRRKANELRNWLQEAEATGAANASPEISRMVDWMQQKLFELEQALSAKRLANVLAAQDLFPETDDLYDPLGNPPSQYRWR